MDCHVASLLAMTVSSILIKTNHKEGKLSIIFFQILSHSRYEIDLSLVELREDLNLIQDRLDFKGSII